MKAVFQKILLINAMLLVATTTAVASPASLYMGAGTGVVVNTDEDGGSFRGAPLTLFAGYGGQMDSSLYLAGEIFGNVNTASMDNNGLKTTYSWGASFIPGLMLGEHLLGFARLGAVRNHFNWTNKTGAEVGVGLQTSLTREWDLRGEYDYITYNGSLKTDQFAVGFVYKLMSM